MAGRAAALATATVFWISTTALGQTGVPGGNDRAKVIASAREIMEKARFCTLITVDGEGRPQARIVGPTAPDAEMNVWIATNVRTRKVGQIRADPRVTLLYFDASDPSYVTILGTAEIVEDATEKATRWQDEWAAFYPGGPGGETFSLIRVTPTRLEIVSESRGFSSHPKTWLPAGIEFH